MLNTVDPVNWGLTSSSVGALCRHHFKAWLTFWGLMHIRSDPSFFTEYARLEHQSVCSLAFWMTPCCSIFFSWDFSLSLRWMGHLSGGSMYSSQSLLRPRSGELRTQKLKSHPVRTQSLNVLPLVYSHTCYAYCQEFLPCLFLPFQSIHLHFSKTLPIFSCDGCG